MRTTAMVTMLILGVTVGHANAQFVGIPKTFQPSLAAEAKRATLKNPPLTRATDVKETLYRIGDALGMLRGTEERDSIITMDWRGTGTMTVNGQSCRVNYRGQVRYLPTASLRTDATCMGGARMVQVVAGNLAWNETTPGVGATPAMDALNDRLVQLWSLPHAVYKGALLAGANAKTSLENGTLYLTYPLPAPAGAMARVALNTTDAIELTMDSGEKYQLSYWVDRVEIRMGNVVTETTYSDYAELNEPDYRSEVMFPKRIVQKRGGTTIADLTIERTNTYNPYVVMPVPANVRAAAPQRAAGQ